MNSYLRCIDESLQRTPTLKCKIRRLQNDLEKTFADKIYSKKFDYDVDVADLEKLFPILNKWLFNGELDEENVKIIVVNNAIRHKDKGIFKLGMDDASKHVIGIVKYEKDNFFHIVNVFIHEMVHYYDLMYGPLKAMSDNARISTYSGKQYVNGTYDAHGDFFKSQCNRINLLGFDVKDKYSLKDKLGMKKILEKKRETNDFFDKKTIVDDKQYKYVKQFYDSLTNCNKDMVYRDANHWYVQID